MNPRTLCACHLVFFIISVSVAPPLRRSSAMTSAFLLPSRVTTGFAAVLRPLGGLAGTLAVLAFLPFFAPPLALLARSGAAATTSVAPPPSKLLRAFHILAIADFRALYFLTGVRPWMPFQAS